MEASKVVSPSKPNTTAGRLLSKRGDGGYMIIMQTEDASARRDYLQSNKLAQVILNHESEDSVCVQYHPKGITGTQVLCHLSQAEIDIWCLSQVLAL